MSIGRRNCGGRLGCGDGKMAQSTNVGNFLLFGFPSHIAAEVLRILVQSFMLVASPPKPRRALSKAPHGAKARLPEGPATLLDPIITLDGKGVIRSASDSVESLFGWTPMELFGKNMRVLIAEPRRSAFDRYIDRYVNAGKAESSLQSRRFEALRKDGSLFQIELSMSRAELPIYLAPFLIGIVRDVSRETEVSPGWLDERTRLHNFMMEQTRALAVAHLGLQLADRMTALGTLASGLGHDLSNVLLPMRARLDALEHANDMESARAHVKAVRSLIVYLQELSDGLHALTLDPDAAAAANDGGGVTQISEWWGQVGALLRKAVPPHVKLSTTISSALPAVGVARHWLTQAALNLIVNAGESIPPGRRAGSIHLWADTTKGGRSVRLGVTDNGRGMTREVQRRALDLFFTTKARSMGTGLGLPLARKVALRAGGELMLSSKVGKGTTVVLEVPAASHASQAMRRTKLTPAVRKQAMVSLKEGRFAALIGQILLGAGLELEPPNSGGPSHAHLWVTDPTQQALELAAGWSSKNPAGILIVVGSPSKKAQPRWATLGASVIAVNDDIQAIRQTLGQALSKL